jgi:hypothetical protein
VQRYAHLSPDHIRAAVEKLAQGNSGSGGVSPREQVARLEGFEPPTPGLEGRCSIQLSYRRVRHLRYTSGGRLTRLEVFLKCRNVDGGSAGTRNQPLHRLPKMGRGQVRVSLDHCQGAQPPGVWTVRVSTPAITKREAKVWRLQCHVYPCRRLASLLAFFRASAARSTAFGKK